MKYSLDKLNSYLASYEGREDAHQILYDYRNSIEEMMLSSLIADTKILLSGLTSEDVEEDANIIRIAQVETAKRMCRYTEIFFTEELERLMDLFNDKNIDVLEFNIRCEILTVLKDVTNTQYEELHDG